MNLSFLLNSNHPVTMGIIVLGVAFVTFKFTDHWQRLLYDPDYNFEYGKAIKCIMKWIKKYIIDILLNKDPRDED